MTMPVSVSAPSAAPASGKAAPVSGPSPKAKGPEGTDTEASGVADMFAALVATLTEQMQPVTEDTATTGETAEVAVEELAVAAAPAEAFLTAPVLLPSATVEVGADAAVAPDAPVIATAALVPEAGVIASPEVATGQPVVSADPPVVPADQRPRAADLDVAPAPAGAEAGEAPVADLATAEDGAQPARPAVPADPHGDVDADGAARARPAAPAQPAAPANDDAAARPVLPAQAAPAAQAAAAVAPAPQPASSASLDASAPDTSGVPVLNLNAPAAPARAEATAPVVAPPPAPVADAHVQVARVVRPLRLSTDGAYELALDLTPAELGRVRIDVELRGSTISLSLRADNPATRELLAGSMNQLRSELESAGLHAGHLDVGGRGTDGRGAPGQERRPGGPTTTGTDETAAAPAAFADSLTDDSVDVRA